MFQAALRLARAARAARAVPWKNNLKQVQVVAPEAVLARSGFPSALGVAMPGTGEAMVRSGLPRPVERFVRSHEAYHLADPIPRSGRGIGHELRASLVPGLSDPVGLAATVLYSMRPSRLGDYARTYLRRGAPAIGPDLERARLLRTWMSRAQSTVPLQGRAIRASGSRRAPRGV